MWAWLDLNQRPHPDQAYWRDGFMLEERDRGQFSGQMATTETDRSCPSLTDQCGTRMAPDPTKAAAPSRPQAVAGLRLVTSPIRLVTSLIPRPIRTNSTPIAIAIAATPKATTEVNSEA